MDNPVRYGFRPSGGKFSSEERCIECVVASAYQAAPGAVNVPLRVGDPVVRVSDGTVALMTAGSAGKCYGVIVGVNQIFDSVLGCTRPSDRVPGGTTYSGIPNQSRVSVALAHANYFEVDCDDAVTATTEAAYQAYRGENADISFTGVLNVGAFPKLDISTHNTTGTLQCNIVDVARTLENRDFSGANVKLKIQFNLVDDNHGLPQTTGV